MLQARNGTGSLCASRATTRRHTSSQSPTCHYLNQGGNLGDTEGASASAGALLVVSFKPCPVEARSFTSSCMGKHRAADMAMNALGESISYRIRYFVAHLMVDVASLAYFLFG